MSHKNRSMLFCKRSKINNCDQLKHLMDKKENKRPKHLYHYFENVSATSNNVVCLCLVRHETKKVVNIIQMEFMSMLPTNWMNDFYHQANHLSHEQRPSLIGCTLRAFCIGGHMCEAVSTKPNHAKKILICNWPKGSTNQYWRSEFAQR